LGIVTIAAVVAPSSSDALQGRTDHEATDERELALVRVRITEG